MIRRDNAGEINMDEAIAALGGTLQFMRALWAVDHSLQAASKRMERTLGVTGLQRMVVRVVGRLPGVSPGDVAAVLHTHPSTLTGVLRRLEQRSLLQRIPDATDGRRERLRLTDKGKKIDQLRAGTVEAAVCRAISDVSPAHLKVTESVLSRVVAELEALDGDVQRGTPSAGLAASRGHEAKGVHPRD